MKTFEYRGHTYPDYIRRGNAMQFIIPIAQQYCSGSGLDVGGGTWCLPGADPVDILNGDDAMNLPARNVDYIFSSHTLEHLADPYAALAHWRDRLRPGGVVFLYLPHPDMLYWHPVTCRKHKHVLHPQDIERGLRELRFMNVMVSGRDLMWSFAAVGQRPWDE